MFYSGVFVAVGLSDLLRYELIQYRLNKCDGRWMNSVDVVDITVRAYLVVIWKSSAPNAIDLLNGRYRSRVRLCVVQWLIVFACLFPDIPEPLGYDTNSFSIQV